MELPETSRPSENKTYTVYSEPGLSLFLIDIDRHLTFHCKIDGEIDKKRLAHLQDVFLNLVLALMDRGFDHLDTWIPYGYDTELAFAESFGFRPTGFDKIVRYYGGDHAFQELRYIFPKVD